MTDNIEKQLEALSEKLDSAQKEITKKSFKDLIVVQNRIYSQIEALTWLSQALTLSGSLPPLRGWAASPDVLLRLHEYVRFEKPKVVVECGSGSSTLVIADALRQNGEGVLISLEHSAEFGGKTQALLEREALTQWVNLRIADLEPWSGPHLNTGQDETVKWYASACLTGIQSVDLLFVDGPPGATCKYARYPALPALLERLAPGAQVWMDDTIRQEETDMAKDWAEKYGYSVEFFALEKGLGVLTPLSCETTAPDAEAESSSVLNASLAVAAVESLQAHAQSLGSATVLQFGVSAATLPLAKALNAANAGHFYCVAEPLEAVDALRIRIRDEGLESVVTVLPAGLEDWAYRYPEKCGSDLKRWFTESVLEQLPPLDWVIVDGPDWHGKPCTRYPALPSVLEQLAPGAEVWMLGAQDGRVGEVVEQWCAEYPVTTFGSAGEAGIIRTRAR